MQGAGCRVWGAGCRGLPDAVVGAEVEHADEKLQRLFLGLRFGVA